MKINKRCTRESVNINSEDIPVGTVFSGEIPDYESKVFLRSFSCVIDLENPHNQWNNDPIIQDYIELEAELTVRRKV